tara:strand:+ start:36 stop:359 length:324 start_codon:yes stop_codon:yes gene_type:complete
MYTWEQELVIGAFRGLKEGQILILKAFDEEFKVYRVWKEVNDPPPDILMINEKKHILCIIYHHVNKKNYNYLMKLAWFYVPASERFNVNSACAMIYKKDKKQRRKKL